MRRPSSVRRMRRINAHKPQVNSYFCRFTRGRSLVRSQPGPHTFTQVVANFRRMRCVRARYVPDGRSKSAQFQGSDYENDYLGRGPDQDGRRASMKLVGPEADDAPGRSSSRASRETSPWSGSQGATPVQASLARLRPVQARSFAGSVAALASCRLYRLRCTSRQVPRRRGGRRRAPPTRSDGNRICGEPSNWWYPSIAARLSSARSRRRGRETSSRCADRGHPALQKQRGHQHQEER